MNLLNAVFHSPSFPLRKTVFWWVCVLGFALEFTRAAETPSYPLTHFSEASGWGKNIQRTMRLLATSTAEKRNTVRILFYGQSITEQKWAKRVEEDLRRRFPHANLVVENRALGGFASQLLAKTAETDLYPFQPDLLIFHVYGAHDKYEDILRRTRERTTAEILMQNDHVTKPADFTEETDAAKVPIQSGEWDAFKNHNWLPSLAKRYGAEQGDAGIIAGVVAFQKDLYAAVKADAATRALKVLGPSLGKTYGYDTKVPFGKGTLTDFVDWGNFHPYPGGNPFSVPSPYAGVEKYTWHGGHPSANIDESPYAFDVYAPPFAPPRPATLKPTKPVKRADIFSPNDGDEIVQTFANTDTLERAVPDRVMVVRLNF